MEVKNKILKAADDDIKHNKRYETHFNLTTNYGVLRVIGFKNFKVILSRKPNRG